LDDTQHFNKDLEGKRRLTKTNS